MPREDRAFRKIACFHREAQGQLTGQSRFGKQKRWAVVLHGAANRAEKVAVVPGSGCLSGGGLWEGMRWRLAHGAADVCCLDASISFVGTSV